MTENLMLYKLIVLYMLRNSAAPLTNGAISEFVLEHEYTDYITLQQSIAELVESDLVRVEESMNGHFYHITEQGQETLKFFKDRISDAIIADITEYFGDNSLSIINDASILTEYYKTTGAGYDVNCKIREKNKIIFDLTVNVDDKAEAESVCRNFKENSQAVYEYVMRNLLK
ncbi:MAG: DUF4364 family protein [Lachnospiraceae bacterium]|nr:DUF4364 family protein [Lachnospiraceae bacterium]